MTQTLRRGGSPSPDNEARVDLRRYRDVFWYELDIGRSANGSGAHIGRGWTTFGFRTEHPGIGDRDRPYRTKFQCVGVLLRTGNGVSDCACAHFLLQLLPYVSR
jgi:hypothetical protein